MLCCAIWRAEKTGMMANEKDNSWFLPASEIERALDRAVDGLARMDSELLVQLACLCREWDAKGAQPIPHAVHARLSWKLLLLDRLLRQTQINLNVLGLQPGQYVRRAGCGILSRR